MPAYDPFIQTVVQSVGRLDQQHYALGPNATIGAAMDLDVGILAASRSGAVGILDLSDDENAEDGNCTLLLDGEWKAQPDLGMVASVYDGFNNRSTSTAQKIAFTCSTGNCTWEPYASLAVCGSCRDVTSHITSSIQNKTESTSFGNRFWGTTKIFSLLLNNISNWEEVDGFEMTDKRDVPVDSTSTIMSARGTINGSALVSFANSTTFLFGFSILYADNRYVNGSTGWNASHPTATECGLELCTSIYSSQVTKGILNETVLHSSINRNISSLLPDPSLLYKDHSNLGCLQDFNEKNNYALLYDWPSVNINIPRSNLQLLAPEAQTAAEYNITANSPTNFFVSDRTLKSTLSWLQSEFTLSDLVWFDYVAPNELNELPDPNFWNQSPIASALLDEHGLGATFDGVAESMTVWMHNLGFTQQQPMVGTTSLWVLHVQVRWAGPFSHFPLLPRWQGACFVSQSSLRRAGWACALGEIAVWQSWRIALGTS